MKEMHTIYMNMPPSVKGMLAKMFDDGEDYYTVIINPMYNMEQQRETYKHEMKHIECQDLDGICDAGVIEMLRHTERGG